MQNNKSIADMIAEKTKLEKALMLPGVPDEEREIYRSAIAEIKRRIAALQKTGAPQQRQPAQPKTSTEPIPVRVIRAGTKHSTVTVSTEKPVISAILTGALKQVVIQWGHGHTDTLTEGEARSRFTTALRDLAESRMARISRFDDVPRYITFSRAVAYYRALVEFWLSPPTAQQLEIYPLSKIRQTIFEMIQQAATAAQLQEK